MPTAEEKRRGGVVRYRTVTAGKGRNKRTIVIAVVPKAGPRGGHTVAGKPRKPKGTK